jgi:hypothetical protein
MKYMFTLSTKTPLMDVEQIDVEQIKTLKETYRGAAFAFNNSGISLRFTKWFAFEMDMCNFSKLYPKEVFQLDLLDKDHNKKRFYFKNNQMQESKVVEIFENYNPKLFLTDYNVKLKMGIMRIEFHKELVTPKVGDILTFDLRHLAEEDYEHSFKMMEKLGIKIYPVEGDNLLWEVTKVRNSSITCVEKLYSFDYIQSLSYNQLVKLIKTLSLDIKVDDYTKSDIVELQEETADVLGMWEEE